jgi:hypothetical protein
MSKSKMVLRNDLDPERTVWYGGNTTEKLHRTEDCECLQRTHRVKSSDLQHAPDRDLCRGPACWPDPSPRDEGQTCPYCGASIDQFDGHLPCDETPETEMGVGKDG